MTTYTNKKTGETISSTLSTADAVKLLGEDSWLSYWIHKCAMDKLNSKHLTSGLLVLERKFWIAKHNNTGRSLRLPKIRVVAEGYKWVISQKANTGNLIIKGGEQDGDSGRFAQAEYAGCILKNDGKFLESRYGASSHMLEACHRFLNEFEADPVEYLLKAGRGLGWCCYCGNRLEDTVSKAHGYGHTCAKNWGLHWDKNGPSEDWLKASTDPLVPEGFPEPSQIQDWLMIADYWEEFGNVKACAEIRERVMELKAAV